MSRFITSAKDPRGGHVRLYWEILDSNAWRCLSASDQRAYVALMRSLLSHNNGDLALPLSVACRHGIGSKTTLAKNLRALVAVGLIANTRKGGATKGGQRLPSLYRLTDREGSEFPGKHVAASKATNEWKQIATLAMGRKKIRDAELLAKEMATKTETRGQKLTLTRSDSDPIDPEIVPETGPWFQAPGQKLTLANQGKPTAAQATARPTG